MTAKSDEQEAVSTQWQIDEAQFRKVKAQSHMIDATTYWHARDVDLSTPTSSNENSGILAVVLDVDGSGDDLVYADLGSTGHLVALDRTISALQEVRAGLAAMYQGYDRPGTCLAQGNWGRCRHDHGHREDHDFPTEADFKKIHDGPIRAAAS